MSLVYSVDKSHDKIYKHNVDDVDIEYIKLKNSWGKDDSVLEVYLDGGWKENGKGDEKKMARLRELAGRAISNLDVDPFVNPESKSNCYYIDFGASKSEEPAVEAVSEEAPVAEEASTVAEEPVVVAEVVDDTVA